MGKKKPRMHEVPSERQSKQPKVDTSWDFKSPEAQEAAIRRARSGAAGVHASGTRRERGRAASKKAAIRDSQRD